MSEISSTTLFHRNSSHLFSLFILQADPEPGEIIRFQRALAQALGAGAVPGSAVWLCPFAGQFLGVPAAPPRAAVNWGTPRVPFSSVLHSPLTSTARLVLPQPCTEFTLPQHQGNAGFTYTAFGVCSDKDPFIWELLWCQEMWQLP